MENDALVKMQKKQTPESQRIQELLANIQTANDTTDRKLHYRRQLEHMLRRLGKNQITFDAHINGMEDALKGSRREQDEITVLTRQLEAGKTKAIHDLHLMQRQVRAAAPRSHYFACTTALRPPHLTPAPPFFPRSRSSAATAPGR